MAITEKLKDYARRFVLVVKGPTVDDVMWQWWAAYEPTISPTTVRQKKRYHTPAHPAAPGLSVCCLFASFGHMISLPSCLALLCML